MLGLAGVEGDGTLCARFTSFNQVGLRKIDISIGEGLNVDANVAAECPLIFNIKLGSYLHDCLVD